MKSIILTILLVIGCLGFSQQTTDEGIQKLFTAALETEHIKSGILHVYSQSRGIDIQLAKSKEDSIYNNSTFYTASVTKMFTATAIGILKDDNKLRFEDKIAQYLPESLLNNIHVLDSVDYSKDLTIAHLLQHTTGLPDYFTDHTTDGSPNIINQLLLNPHKSWSAEEMIAFTKQKMTPHFSPGAGYHYTDTEYVLLALIIENISGLTFHQFLLQHIFQPLQMNNSYINLKSAPIENTFSMTEFYAGDIKLSSLKSLSADWGGGGLVSTTKDLITFLKAFNTNQIVTKATRLAMQSWTHETKGMTYGFGIRKISIKDLMDTNSDVQLIGHSGSTAAFLWYCPQLDTYISGTLNQLEASKSALILVYDVLQIIENKN